MKTYLANTTAAIIFFLFMGLFSLAAADSTSPQGQEIVSQPVTEGTPEKMASSQDLPVFTLPEVVCRAKKPPSEPDDLFDRIMRTKIATIKIPKIRMVNYSTLINEITNTRK